MQPRFICDTYAQQHNGHSEFHMAQALHGGTVRAHMPPRSLSAPNLMLLHDLERGLFHGLR